MHARICKILLNQQDFAVLRCIKSFTDRVHMSCTQFTCKTMSKNSVYCKGERHTYPIAEAPVGHNPVTTSGLCATQCSVGSSHYCTYSPLCIHKKISFGRSMILVKELFNYFTQVCLYSMMIKFCYLCCSTFFRTDNFAATQG